MAEEKSTPQVGYPTREIRVTGERVGSMVALTIATSRLEQSLIQMSMSNSPAIRRAHREANEIFQRAINQFEDNLRDAQKVLDQAGRGANQQGRRTPGRTQPQGQGQRQQPAKAQTSTEPKQVAEQKPAAAPAAEKNTPAPQQAAAATAPQAAPQPSERQQRDGQQDSSNREVNNQSGQQPRQHNQNGQGGQRGNQQGQPREQRQQPQAAVKHEAEAAPVLD